MDYSDAAMDFTANDARAMVYAVHGDPVSTAIEQIKSAAKRGECEVKLLDEFWWPSNPPTAGWVAARDQLQQCKGFRVSHFAEDDEYCMDRRGTIVQW